MTVRDTAPPAISGAAPDQTSLWPPNHKMRVVNLSAAVADLSDRAPSRRVTAVGSNEAAGAEPDWEITGPMSVNLRAEREGSGTGRIYTITLTATDASGNSSDTQVTVSVPHDKR